jgi:DNA-directed RNA polymerase specialized sigma subunit
MSLNDLTEQESVLWKTYFENEQDLTKTAKELGISISKTSRIVKKIKYKLNINKFKEPIIMSLNDLTEYENVLWKTYFENEKDLAKTAKELGISISQTSRIVKKVEHKLNIN